MPEPVIVGNWKMNTNLGQAIKLATDIDARLKNWQGARVVLCPPFPFLPGVSAALQNSQVKVGAQNMHWEPSGAFTGEVSPEMLQGLCEYVILGHSERRQLFCETDDLINRKVQSALSNNLRPILCVGETLEERESGRAKSVVSEQVRQGLKQIENVASLLVAYEPVWAIGTGLAATPEDAAEVMAGGIKEILEELFGDVGRGVPLIYGGSVNAGNIADFAAQDAIDGALVGGASLLAEQFAEIAKTSVATKASRRE